MLKKKFRFLSVLLSFALMFIGLAQTVDAAKPTTGAACKQCHQPADDTVRGTFVSASEKFRTIQVAVGSLVWVIKYGDDLKLTGAAKLSDIPKDKEVGVRFTGGEKTPYAASLAVKPPAKVAPDKLVSLAEMTKLIEMGPEKGNYVLIDSRPPARYREGHLLYAVNLPLDKFDANKDKVLPKEKNKLLIFYCGGMT